MKPLPVKVRGRLMPAAKIVSQRVAIHIFPPARHLKAQNIATFLIEKLPHLRKLHVLVRPNPPARTEAPIPAAPARVRVLNDRILLLDAGVEMHLADCVLQPGGGGASSSALGGIPAVSFVRAASDHTFAQVALHGEHHHATIELDEAARSGELQSAAYGRLRCRQCRAALCDFSAFAAREKPTALRSAAAMAAASERLSAILFNPSLAATLTQRRHEQQRERRQHGDDNDSGSSVAQQPLPLKVLPLPSDHWQELTDLWVCHSEQTFAAPLAELWRQARGDHVLCPPPGVLYVGAHHVLMHPHHVNAAAITVSIGAEADEDNDEQSERKGTQAPLGRAGGDTADDAPSSQSRPSASTFEWIDVPDAPPPLPTSDASTSSHSEHAAPAPAPAPGPLSKGASNALLNDVWRAMHCASCAAPLGLALLAIPPPPPMPPAAPASSSNTVSAAASTSLPSEAPVAHASALTIKFFKDALVNESLTAPAPPSSTASPSESPTAAAAASSVGTLSTLWDRYSIETRVAAALVAAAKAHGRYRFVLRARTPRTVVGRLRPPPLPSASASASASSSSSALPAVNDSSVCSNHTECADRVPQHAPSSSSSPPPLCLVIAIVHLDCAIAADALPNGAAAGPLPSLAHQIESLRRAATASTVAAAVTAGAEVAGIDERGQAAAEAEAAEAEAEANRIEALAAADALQASVAGFVSKQTCAFSFCVASLAQFECLYLTVSLVTVHSFFVFFSEFYRLHHRHF